MEDTNLEKQELNFESKNPYIVLQINEDASKTEIKKAYKILAKKYHPDLNKNDEATKIFIQINAAYQILINDETKAQYDNGTYYENNNFDSEENQYTPTEEEAFNYLSPKEKRVNLFVKLAAFWFVPFTFSIIMTMLYYNVFYQSKNNMDLEDIELFRYYVILFSLGIYYVINGIIFFIFKNTIGGILFGYKYYDLYTNEKISSKQMVKISISYFSFKFRSFLNVLSPIGALINVIRSLIVKFSYGVSFTDIECEIKKQKSNNLRNKFSILGSFISLIVFVIAFTSLLNQKYDKGLDKKSYFTCVQEKFTTEDYTSVLKNKTHSKDLSKIKTSDELYDYVDKQINNSCTKRLSDSKVNYTYSNSDILDIALKLDSHSRYNKNYNSIKEDMDNTHEKILEQWNKTHKNNQLEN